MRILLDVSADADNHITGTATWGNGGSPVAFSGWLALMLLMEQANLSQSDGGRPSELFEHSRDQVAQQGADQ